MKTKSSLSGVGISAITLAALCLSLAVSASISSASASDSSRRPQPSAAEESAGGRPLPPCTVTASTPRRVAPDDPQAGIEADLTCPRGLLPERFDFAVCLQSKFNGVFKNIGCCRVIDTRVDQSPWLMCAEAWPLRQGGPFTYRTRAKATRLHDGVSEVGVSGTVVFTN
jgi:hypothetical protein